MKKLCFLLLILLFPLLVYGEECSSSSIVLESINLEDVTGNAEEKNEASVDNNKVELDIKLYDPGDSLEYSIKVKNDSKDDYYFDEESIKKETDYISYEFTYDDNSIIVKGNTTKDVKLRVEYKNKVQEEKLTNSSLNTTDSLKFDLTSIEPEIISTPTPTSTPSEVVIPDTGTTSLLFIVVLLVLGIALIIKEKKLNIFIIILGLIIIYPLYVKAVCKAEIIVESKIEIDGKEAYFLTGPEVNVKMKQLAGNDTSTDNEKTIDSNVTAIIISEVEPTSNNKENKNVVSTDESPYPIYTWYEDGKIYLWSEDLTPNVNEDATGMFRNYANLTDISGVEDFDTSHTTIMQTMFSGTKTNSMKITNLKPLSKWDTSKVTDMAGTFQYNTELETLEGLENWDVSSVTTMKLMFLGQLANPMGLTNIDAIKDWDVSKVTDMTGLFQANRELTSLKALKNWNVSNVEILNGTFIACTSLTTLEGLESWNTSKVTNMASLFHNCNHLVDATAIKDWDVSNVTAMNNMFNVSSDMTEQSYGLLVHLDISNWNMEKVRIYNWFIASQPYIETEFTIRNTSPLSTNGMIANTANAGGHVVINYVEGTESKVDAIVASRYANANVEKGRLVE